MSNKNKYNSMKIWIIKLQWFCNCKRPTYLILEENDCDKVYKNAVKSMQMEKAALWN